MHSSVKKLLNGFIVSCQAYEDTPLYGAEYMKIMAESAILGGANGLRACWKQDIAAIRSITDLPIIGINKVMYDENGNKNKVFITPTYESALSVIEAGADIVAMDCTLQFRSYDEVISEVKKIKERFPSIAIMADISCVEEGVRMAESGLIDIISSTLSNRRLDDLNKNDGPDIEIIKELKKRISLPINAEGRIWDIDHYRSVLDAGADMVTVGTAITRPHLITRRFTHFKDLWLGKEKDK